MTPQMMIERVRSIHPLAGAQETLEAQRDALKERALHLEIIWMANPWVQSAYPDEFWETGEGSWCFCAYKPEGHPQGELMPFAELQQKLPQHPECLFADGQDSALMCPCCRQPAQVKVHNQREPRGYYGSAPAYENVCEITTACCGEEPVLPNGSNLNNVDLEDLR